jgi:hypothetical protein
MISVGYGQRKRVKNGIFFLSFSDTYRVRP